jgi:hypothetical protein
MKKGDVPADFDPAMYVRFNPDLVGGSIDPTEHYRAYGRNEGRPYRISDVPYDQDGLQSVHNHDFMDDPDFCRAYARGVQAAGSDYNWHWRVYIGLWVAEHALRLKGSFVECGVGKGFLSSAIMERYDWNSLGRSFWLLDTFAGLDERYLTDEEIQKGVLVRSKQQYEEGGVYTNDIDQVVDNFSEWDRVQIIKGSVPDTLFQVHADEIAYLHIDMNCAMPEVEALQYFWPKLTPGAAVLFDDYAYWGYETQKHALDKLVDELGVSILSLPTGQGLVFAPNSIGA